jgi:acylphosphatase
MSAARRFTIKGRVQGVFFRDSTRREALTLGITGYAVNLPDGDVEVLACGDADRLAKLELWLRQGPPLSRVDSIASEDVAMNELAAEQAHTFKTA